MQLYSIFIHLSTFLYKYAFFVLVILISYYFRKVINYGIMKLDKGAEPWQSGNATDSKSVEPCKAAQGFKSPWLLISRVLYSQLYYIRKMIVLNTLTPFPPVCIRLHHEVFLFKIIRFHILINQIWIAHLSNIKEKFNCRKIKISKSNEN